MNNTLITKRQRLGGTVLALFALLAWFMPGFAMACVVSESLVQPVQHTAAQHSKAPHPMEHCQEMATGASFQNGQSGPMSCCLQIPVPSSSAQKSLFTASSAERQIQPQTLAFPSSFAPLWVLMIAVASLDCSEVTQSTFPPGNFAVPPSRDAASPQPGRAPPSLV